MLTSVALVSVVGVGLVLGGIAPPSQEPHGNHRAAHEKFQDEHLKDGKHNEDLDHQAILGSKAAAEEFDHLSPEESKRRLAILAKKMDKDGDGKVSKDELKAWIHVSLQQLDAEEVHERFDEIDEDKDGQITWFEYKRDAFGDEEEEGHMDDDDMDAIGLHLYEATGFTVSQKLMEEDRKYFDAADRNVNARLDKEEFAAFQNPEHHDHMHTTLVALTLKEKDKDGDGKISFAEFMGEVADKPDSEWHQMEKERFETDYDKNKDGFLDDGEMKAWLVPDISQTATEEMNHLFKEADKDEDGSLTPDEIVEEHQLFVGSEATNYGDHLEKMDKSEL